VTLTRAIRWISRDHDPIRRLCVACLRQSRHHPAGLRRNYTTARYRGFPVCLRHSDTQAADLLHYRIGAKPCP
jgi:hypothetical protein